VLGSPIDHSKSPAMHRAAYAALGWSVWTYDRREVRAEELSGVLDDDRDHIGFSLTMPLKEQAVALADQRGWHVDSAAALTGAANTWVREGSSAQLLNTDVLGISAALTAAGCTEPGSGNLAGEVSIVGSGATAGSALVAAASLGVSRIRVFARNPSARARLVELGQRSGVEVREAGLEELSLGAADITICTLPAGTLPPAAPQAAPHSGEAPVLFDVAYAPAAQPLARAWQQGGGRVVPGVLMLAYQAIAQLRVFGRAAGMPELSPRDDDAVLAAMLNAVGLTLPPQP